MASTLPTSGKNRSMMAFRLLKKSMKAPIETKVIHTSWASKRKRASTYGVTIVESPLGRKRSPSIPIDILLVLSISCTSSRHVYLDVTSMISLIPYTFLKFLESKKVGCSILHSIVTRAYILIVDLNYIVKVQTDLEGL